MKKYLLIIEDDFMRKTKIYCAKHDKSIKQCIVESVEQTIKEAEKKENDNQVGTNQTNT